jgi:hypothetical protein
VMSTLALSSFRLIFLLAIITSRFIIIAILYFLNGEIEVFFYPQSIAEYITQHDEPQAKDYRCEIDTRA